MKIMLNVKLSLCLKHVTEISQLYTFNVFIYLTIEGLNVTYLHTHTHTHTHVKQRDPCICPNVNCYIFTLQAVVGRRGLVACSLSSFTGCEVESEVSGVFFLLLAIRSLVHSFTFFTLPLSLDFFFTARMSL